MAAVPLTSAQRAAIRLYCGWGVRYRQTDSRLEQAMNAIDAGDDDSMAVITNLLTECAAMDVKIKAAYSHLKVAELGTIKLQGVTEIGMLRSEGRRFAGRLAVAMGVEVRQDVFSGDVPRSVFRGQGRNNLPAMG